MPTWQTEIPLMQQGYHWAVQAKVNVMRESVTVYPPAERVFYALDSTPFDAVQVVIVGQDPYHGAGQANGLAFSVTEGLRIPPSLRNIFKEIQNDIYGGEAQPHFSTDLTRWAAQGVLLLNASLTVEAGQAASHKKLGWHALTDQIIAELSAKREHRVFILWGRHAQAKRTLIDAERHLILAAAHPSPLSAHRGFFGCRHFSQTNVYLEKHGGKGIKW